MTRLMADWMSTWVDAAARDERGKPTGMLPTAIHWPDGRIGGLGEKWWMPVIVAAPESLIVGTVANDAARTTGGLRSGRTGDGMAGCATCMSEMAKLRRSSRHWTSRRRCGSCRAPASG